MSARGAPSPRLMPTAVAWTGSRLLVWGGRVATRSPGSLRLLGDGAQYDPAADRWTPMSSVNAPSPRTDATVAWTGRRLVVLGGASEVAGPSQRDGGIYDPATDRWTRLEAPSGDIELPRGNIGPLTRIMVAPDGRVVFVPDGAGRIAILDADQARWSIVNADAPGKRASFRAFLVGRRLIVWGGLTVIAEHRCPPPVPGQPLCDPFAETAPHNDGWMMLLPP
jgi:N-acetylneuraminic acid mutarotase